MDFLTYLTDGVNQASANYRARALGVDVQSIIDHHAESYADRANGLMAACFGAGSDEEEAKNALDCAVATLRIECVKAFFNRLTLEQLTSICNGLDAAAAIYGDSTAPELMISGESFDSAKLCGQWNLSHPEQPV